METGKVEFAPDYKSRQLRAGADGLIRVIASGASTDSVNLNELAEHSRLEREVLKAVKVAWIDGLILSTTLNDAVKALVEFEAKQETK